MLDDNLFLMVSISVSIFPFQFLLDAPCKLTLKEVLSKYVANSPLWFNLLYLQTSGAHCLKIINMNFQVV